MRMSFSKYTGCGNDFILIDNRLAIFPHREKALIQELCQRTSGIGADGIVLLEASKKADFKMRIFNSDGSEAEMCGNGIRCLLKFVHELGFPRKMYTIETMKKILQATFMGEDISIQMGLPTDMSWDLEIPLKQQSYVLHHLNTGVPHAVLFVKNIETIDVRQIGGEIRHHPLFSPRGVNVTFAQIEPKGTLSVRTFERGVEDETFACGTGATAAALASAHKYGLRSPIQVQTRSKEILEIGFSSPGNVTLTGAAKLVFRGEVNLDHSQTAKLR